MDQVQKLKELKAASDICTDAVIAEGREIAARIFQSETPDFWMDAAKDRVENLKAFVETFDANTSGMSKAEKNRVVKRTGFKIKTINEWRTYLKHPDEFARKLAFEICCAVNEATQ